MQKSLKKRQSYSQKQSGIFFMTQRVGYNRKPTSVRNLKNNQRVRRGSPVGEVDEAVDCLVQYAVEMIWIGDRERE